MTNYTLEKYNCLFVGSLTYFLSLTGLDKMYSNFLYTSCLLFPDKIGVSENEEYQSPSVLNFLSIHFTHFIQLMSNTLVCVKIKLNCLLFKQQFKCE